MSGRVLAARPGTGVRAAAWLALALAGASGAGCRERPTDLREWRPSDHSREPGESLPNPNLPALEDNDPTVAGDAIYASLCASCHGATGRGDGPAATMIHPADFTTRVFQEGHSDDQMRAAITSGRGAMPAFGQSLSPAGVDALVQRIRRLRTAPP